MSLRDKIKNISKELKSVEELEKYLESGTFISNIERFGSFPSDYEFRIKGDFRCGSAIEGSHEQRMWAAAQRGLKLLNDEMKNEARAIVDEFNEGLK